MPNDWPPPEWAAPAEADEALAGFHKEMERGAEMEWDSLQTLAEAYDTAISTPPPPGSDWKTNPRWADRPPMSVRSTAVRGTEGQRADAIEFLEKHADMSQSPQQRRAAFKAWQTSERQQRYRDTMLQHLQGTTNAR